VVRSNIHHPASFPHVLGDRPYYFLAATFGAFFKPLFIVLTPSTDGASNDIVWFIPSPQLPLPPPPHGSSAFFKATWFVGGVLSLVLFPFGAPSPLPSPFLYFWQFFSSRSHCSFQPLLPLGFFLTFSLFLPLVLFFSPRCGSRGFPLAALPCF